MPNREKASEIEDVATEWVARAERGLGAEERVELDAWLEGDSRRLGAFVRAQAAWVHAERAAALGKMPDGEPIELIGSTEVQSPTARRVSRRLVLGGGGAMAASVVAAGLLGWQRYRTLESGVGEIRHITLADGSGLTLDTDTRVDIAMGSNDRSLILRRGKLFLDVAGSSVASITVGVGNLLIETTKCAFELQSLLNAPVVALVTQGALSVSQSGGLFGSRRNLTVTEGHALSVPSEGQLSAGNVRSIAASNAAKLLAWRDGMLSFGGETLGEAVRQFDRYSAQRITVLDPNLGRQRITGLFKADDPKGFAMAIAASFGAVVNANGNELQLNLKKVPAA